MIKYDPELFFCEYVRIKKITSGYIYVTTRADGTAYHSDNSIKAKYQKRDISKIKVHENVSRQYFKNNSIKEFSDLGQFACIAFYGDIVISIEVQSLKKNKSDNVAWVATIDRVMNNIYSVIPSDDDVYINGKEIFWVDKSDPRNNVDDPDSRLNVSKDGCFTLRIVKYLSLSKIGVTVMEGDNEESFNTEVIKTIGMKRNLVGENLINLVFDKSYIERKGDKTAAVAFIKSSYVLAYNPYINDKSYDCYSPILDFSDDLISSAGQKEKIVINTLYNLKDFDNFKQNPSFLNLDFALHSGKLIGELYGFEETEILKISEIVKETGMVSFRKITSDSRVNYPINLMPFDGLAWLFKYVNKEKDLNTQRDLSNLFSKIFKQGFVAANKVEVKFKMGKSEDDIKMLDYKVV